MMSSVIFDDLGKRATSQLLVETSYSAGSTRFW
jgi:hypothetical protein